MKKVSGTKGCSPGSCLTIARTIWALLSWLTRLAARKSAGGDADVDVQGVDVDPVDRLVERAQGADLVDRARRASAGERESESRSAKPPATLAPKSQVQRVLRVAVGLRFAVVARFAGRAGLSFFSTRRSTPPPGG